jgi:sugar phosphate isomerase/epimerase
MNRRAFVAKSALLGATALIPNELLVKAALHNYKMGYQLFSVNQDMIKYPITTIKALKEMGYEHFEIYGFDDAKVSYYGIDAQSLRHIMDDLNLQMTSGHYVFAPYLLKPMDDMKRFVDQCIKGAKALGSPYITWPLIPKDMRTLENFKILVERLNIIGAQINDAGLGFAYHNHGYEFDLYDGVMAYELIANETDPKLVKLQMDMYWVMHSGKRTPKQLVESHKGRYAMWHLKDMHTVSRDYTELGNGSIDYTKIMPKPKDSGLEYVYIEQGSNFAQSPLQSAANSAEYYKKNLMPLL